MARQEGASPTAQPIFDEPQVVTPFTDHVAQSPRRHVAADNPANSTQKTPNEKRKRNDKRARLPQVQDGAQESVDGPGRRARAHFTFAFPVDP